MQKKLITVAVAGALAVPGIAMAQSAVEVYGTINMAIGQFKYSEGTAAQTVDGGTIGAQQASVSKWDVSQGASNYGIRARESLGGGLAAWGQFEQNAPMERSNNPAITPASRNSAVGMQGGFGNVFLGQWTTPWADLDALWGIGTVGYWGPVTSIIGRRETTGTAPNPNCGSQGGSGGGGNPAVGAPICDAIEGAGGVGHPFWRRFSQAIFYQSPVMAGVQVKLAYQTNEGKATSNPSTNADPSAFSASVQWAGMGGRARIGGAYDKHKDYTSLGASDTGYSVKGGWNFGVVDVGFAYEKMTYKCQVSAIGIPGLCADNGDIGAKQYAVALAIPIGPGSIRASYSVAKDLDGVIGGAPTIGADGRTITAPGAHISDTGAKQYNIGYEHRFSKRTNVGIGYAKIDNKANAQFTWTGAPPRQSGDSNTPFFGSDVSTFFVSMTHRF
jgi:predicted porin